MRTRTIATALVLAVIGVWLAVPAVASNDTYRDQQWALDLVGAERAWAKTTGSGVTIAIVDTGVDLQHEDLAPRLVAGYNVIDPGSPPQDDDGHGTHVAGIAAAAANNGKGVAGVAPGARIMPVRVMEHTPNGASGTIEDITTGVRWAVDHGAKVVNLSMSEGALFRNLSGGSLSSAIAYAWQRGAVPVVTAGNDGLFPSGYRGVDALVVTAVGRDDRIASYASGVGPFAQWGIAAPGGTGGSTAAGNVVGPYWVEGSKNRYAYLAGTSMAAPHVSGAAALLATRGLSNREIVTRLLETAKDLGPAGNDSDYGHGRLDIAAAAETLPAKTAGTTSTRTPRPVPPTAPPNRPAAAPRTAAMSGPRPTPAPPSVVPASVAPSAQPSGSPRVVALPAPRRAARTPLLLVLAGAAAGLAVAAALVASRRA